MKILITGGSGFIGTNAVKHFRKISDVLNVDIATPKDEEDLDVWKRIDITDSNEVIKEICEFCPDYILHLAARTDLDGESIDDYSANTIGVRNILESAQKLPNLKKVIIASSMLVCEPGYIPKSQKDYAPTTMYGKSKIETENITWSANLKCDWCLIRPSSIWGEYFGVPYRNFFDMVLAKKYFHIGHRGCTKTYGYVGNAIYEIECLLFSQTHDNDNKVFYVGDYEPTNIEEWADEISIQVYGRRMPHIPYLLVCCAAKFGDVLKKFGVHFPMTSFRLHNMTTNNIVPLDNTMKIAPQLPFSRREGIQRTLEWIHRVREI